MRALSARFVNKLQDNSTLLVKASIAYADGSRQELSGDDFISLEVEQASSSEGSFDIGAAIIGQLSCTLNNYDGRFDERDFGGAVLKPSVGASFGDEEEWVPLGVFTVDRPDSYSGQVQLTALDNLSKLEKPADFSKLEFPLTFGQLAETACDECGVTLYSSSFPSSEFSISSRPSVTSESTWLDVIGWVAQLCCRFVVANDYGDIAFRWYSLSSEKEEWADGGAFDASSPFASGDSLDGGTLVDYASGDNCEGGTFIGMKQRVVLNRNSSLTVFTDDVVITGVKVKEANEVVVSADGKESNGEDGRTFLACNDESYVLSIEDNPLAIYGTGKALASRLASLVVGMRFRPFESESVSDPSIEVGDAAIIWDRQGRRYDSFITSTRLSVNGCEKLGCSAKSASRNSADKASAATKAIVMAREDLKREKSGRDRAIESLAEKMQGSSGLYSTSAAQADGSTIYFLHDKPELGSSRVIWKMTSTGVAVSDDGGATYSTGVTADGVAILKRIYAEGIDASHITSGVLDASTVKIKNLVSIGGNDRNSLSLDSGGITFRYDGIQSLRIEPGGVIPIEYTASKIIGEYSGPVSKTINADVNPGNPHGGSFVPVKDTDGTYLIRFSVDAEIYYSSLGRSKLISSPIYAMRVSGGSTTGYENFHRKEIFNDGKIVITFVACSGANVDSRSDSNLELKVDLSSNETVKVISAKVTIDSDEKYYPSIFSPHSGVSFLTNKNYWKAFPSCASGTVVIPFAYNNILLNFRLTFDNGIFCGCEVITPSDSRFQAFGLNLG